MEEVTLGILLGIISMLGYGLSNAISKVPAKKIGPIKTTFFRGFFLTLLLLGVLFFIVDEIVISWWHIGFVVLLSIGGYIPLLTFYKGLQLGKVGVITPIASSSVIITVILSVIFFKESLNQMQIIAICLIVAGIILLSVDFKNFKKSDLFRWKSGIPYALVTCVIWGIGFALFKIPVMIIGPVLTAVILEGGITIISGLHLNRLKEKFSLNKSVRLHIILLAVTGLIGSLSFNMGIMHYDVSIVAPIAFSGPLISALYGRLIYNEHLKNKQLLAMALIILGIIVISYYSG